MKIYCTCCGRQIVNHNEDTKKTIGGKPSTCMGQGKYCCYKCSEDLDENGMFPEERIINE